MLDPRALPFAADVHSDARPARRLTWDSREAGPDVAFVALPGEAMHGNRFVQAALDAGAPFVLTDLDVPRAVRVPDAQAALLAWAQHERARASLVVGITGTAGKTTAKSYAAAALDAAYLPVFNTPPAIATFLIEHGASGRPLVVEMGIDRLGEMAELVELVRPDVGVITSIGAAHLEGLGSVENIVREKGVILGARERLVGVQAGPYYPGVPTYGFGDAAHAGTDLRLDASGAGFRFGGVDVTLPQASRVQAEAAVLGLELARRAGVDLHAAAERLSRVTCRAAGTGCCRARLQSSTTRTTPRRSACAWRSTRSRHSPRPRRAVGASACWAACWNSGRRNGNCTPGWASTPGSART